MDYRRIEADAAGKRAKGRAYVGAAVACCALVVCGVASMGSSNVLGLGLSSAAVRSTTATVRSTTPIRTPTITIPTITRDVSCLAGKNHWRRTRKTLEKVDMPSDIEILGPDPMQRKGAVYYPKLADTKAAKENWFILDAQDQVLGRLATLAATLVMGKWHPLFSPSMNMGANVVIINADKVRVTGRKYTDKLYKRHTTGHPGKMKVETFKDLQARIPERIVEKAIRGMLPHTRLGREQYKQLHIYAGDENPHAAQKPLDLTYKISKPQREVYKQDRELVAN